jgi:hypothetical protein
MCLTRTLHKKPSNEGYARLARKPRLFLHPFTVYPLVWDDNPSDIFTLILSSNLWTEIAGDVCVFNLSLLLEVCFRLFCRGLNPYFFFAYSSGCVTTMRLENNETFGP